MTAQRKPKITFSTMETIPVHFQEAFKKKVEASREYILKYVAGADITLGAFEGNKLVGVFSGVTRQDNKFVEAGSRNCLVLTSAYVRPEYRNRRIFHNAIFWFVNEARKSGLKGVFLYGMERPSKSYFARQKKSPRRQKDRLGFTHLAGDHGLVTFPNQAKPMRAAQRRLG